MLCVGLHQTVEAPWRNQARRYVPANEPPPPPPRLHTHPYIYTGRLMDRLKRYLCLRIVFMCLEDVIRKYMLTYYIIILYKKPQVLPMLTFVKKHNVFVK